jgi:hypothetical protein
MNVYNSLIKRYSSIERKINSLTSIRLLVALKVDTDLTPRQWNCIETLLFQVKKDLLSQIKPILTVRPINDSSSNTYINSILADAELRLNTGVKLFDTYLDLATQRNSIVLGAMLGGCDVFAADAIKQKHPILQLSETPMTYLERGFGGAVLRENIEFYGYKNPSPLIQIPYSMLTTSFMACTIAHEAGHVSLPKLQLEKSFSNFIYEKLKNAGAPHKIRDLYTLWYREIFADLYAFLCCGTAQSGIRDLLALSDNIVFDIRENDPHPVNYIRVLMSFEWCRLMWGHGIWDNWEEEWKSLYPISKSNSKHVKTIIELKEFLPLLSRGVLNWNVSHLGMKFIDLFNMAPLNPNNLRRICENSTKIKHVLKQLTPCHQFAVFRFMYDENMLSGKQANKIIHKWLYQLNSLKNSLYDI